MDKKKESILQGSQHHEQTRIDEGRTIPIMISVDQSTRNRGFYGPKAIITVRMATDQDG